MGLSIKLIEYYKQHFLKLSALLLPTSYEYYLHLLVLSPGHEIKKDRESAVGGTKCQRNVGGDLKHYVNQAFEDFVSYENANRCRTISWKIGFIFRCLGTGKGDRFRNLLMDV